MMAAPPSFDLEGRAALVTGGSRGEALGRAGTSVAVTSRSLKALDATLAELKACGVDACAVEHDVASVEGCRTAVKQAVKIVGPGSPWVVAAKRLLSGVIDTGLPASPSEALIFADGTVDGRLAALDVLIEAEHGPDSSAYIVTPSREVAEAAQAALREYWAHMKPQRVAYSQAVLRGERGGVILTGSLQESYDFINACAPEHLEILSAEPFRHLGAITEAAEILLGPHTPVTIANFVLGPNCVLPTSRWARSYGPLSVTDFLKRSSVGYVTSDAYPELAARARTLAHCEGFSSHENAVSEIRDKILNRDGRLANRAWSSPVERDSIDGIARRFRRR
jgi:histidinol dehydrogenase